MAKQSAFEKSVLKMKPGGTLADPAVPGLRYRARKTGIYAELRYKAPDGKWRATPLGQFTPHNSPFAHMTGDDPLTQMRAKAVQRTAEGPPEAPTPSEFVTFSQALETRFKRGRKGKPHSDRTVTEYRDKARLHLSDWLHRPLKSITGEEVFARYHKICKATSHHTAVGAMRVFSSAWNSENKLQLGALGPCPTMAIEWPDQEPADRAIASADLPGWYAAVMALSPIKRDFYLLVAWTGLRRRSADRIKREHIDLEAGTLFIPLPKGGESKAFSLPLSAFALDIIRRRLAENEAWWGQVEYWAKRHGRPIPKRNEYLFPAHSAAGHIAEPRVDGLPSPHALRATYASAAAAAKVSVYHLKVLMNHARMRGDVTGTYVTAKDLQALRDAQDDISAKLCGWCGIGEAAVA